MVSGGCIVAGERGGGCSVSWAVPDGVAGAQADPLGQRAVLFLGPGKLLLDAERFLALGGEKGERRKSQHGR